VTKNVVVVTDFGDQDSYIAELYAPIVLNCPSVRIIEVTHQVPSGAVERGAYLLGRVANRFPAGSLFLGVIDPGVGTSRQAVVIRNNDRYFVGPDNGLFNRAIDWSKPVEVRLLAMKRELTTPTTFDGRDLFAPAVGELCAGRFFEEIGIQGQLMATSKPLQAAWIGDHWIGEVIYTDRFGNIATNLPNQLTGSLKLNETRIFRHVAAYADIPTGETAILYGSDGCLEIGANRASAEALLDAKIGDPVICTTDGRDDQ